MTNQMDKETWKKGLARLKENHLRMENLMKSVGGEEGLDRYFNMVKDEFIPLGDLKVHLDVFEAQKSPAKGTVVFTPGIGAYARFYICVLGKLADAGYNVLGMDRPGHGYSEGARGDYNVEQAFELMRKTMDIAKERFGGPIILMGSSLGGVLTFMALLAGIKADAAVCHNIALFSIPPEGTPAGANPNDMLAKIPPDTLIPIKMIANFDALSVDPSLKELVKKEDDPIFNWKLTAGSFKSFVDFKPPPAPVKIDTPALILVGKEDKMVEPSYMKHVLDVVGAEGPEFAELEGLAHLLFHDHLDESLKFVLDWLDKKLPDTNK